MASWSTTTKHEPTEINGGNKYEIGDQVSIEHLNAITENTFNTANKDLSNVDIVEWQNKLNTKVYAHNIAIKGWECRVQIITDNDTPFSYTSLAQYLYNNGFTEDTKGYICGGARSNSSLWLSRYLIYSTQGTDIVCLSSSGGGTVNETLNTSIAFADMVIEIN